jgi:dolichol-phosphate hexosyltransferase
MKVSIIIPTRNEAHGIAGIIEKIKKYGDEVIVIDGHSTDGTAELAASAGAKVFSDNGKGKGDGLRVGIEKASHEVLLFIDADGSHEIDDIPKVLQPVLSGEADMVVASRVKGGSDDFYLNFDNLIRQIGSQLATYLVNRKFHAKLTDIQNGFRAIKKNCAEELKLTSNNFEIEEEMIIRCLKKKHRISEVASHEFERQWGTAKLRTGMGWSILYKLIAELYF